MGLTTVDVDVLPATGEYEREPAGNSLDLHRKAWVGQGGFPIAWVGLTTFLSPIAAAAATLDASAVSASNLSTEETGVGEAAQRNREFLEVGADPATGRRLICSNLILGWAPANRLANLIC